MLKTEKKYNALTAFTKAVIVGRQFTQKRIPKINKQKHVAPNFKVVKRTFKQRVKLLQV